MFQFPALIQGFQMMSHHGHPPLNKLPNLYIWLDHKEEKSWGQLGALRILGDHFNWY